jgi:hypothetical protein
MIRATDISFADIVQSRSADDGTAELIAATNEFNSVLQTLARQFPGSAGIGAIVGGQACQAFVYSASAGTYHYSPVAPSQLRTLAIIIANLPEELVNAFQTEFNLIQTKKKLDTEIAAIRGRLEHGEEKP